MGARKRSLVTLARLVALAASGALHACGGSGSGVDATRLQRAPQTQVEELRTTQPLMEGWRFVKDDDLSEEDALAASGEDWQPVTLPHTWNAEDAASLNAGSYDRGRGWYRLEFVTPPAGVRHWLEFGAASLVADVWLNGEKLGQHRGGFTQFRFDVTDRLAESRSNVLLVRCDNSVPHENDDPTAIDPLGGDFNKSGGLYRHVALISTAAPAHVALGDLGGPGVYAATTALDGTNATVEVRVKLRNEADAGADHAVRATLVDAGGQIAATAELPVRLEGRADAEVTLRLAVANARPWQGVADPHLYTLVVDLVDAGGNAIDRVVQRFGIRELRFDPEQGFFLNGQHVRLRGVAMHQDQLGKGWAITDADLDASLAFFTEIGANAIRLGHYPFARHALERVSELGLVAWAEKPAGLRTRVDSCDLEEPTEEFMENARQQLRELIRQQYNHAAVAVWSIGNETTAGHIGCEEVGDNATPYLRELHRVAKEEDPTRPTIYSEFPHPVTERRRTGPFVTEGITDLFATNRYFGWYHDPLEIENLGPLLDTVHDLAEGQPLAVSEYGAGAALTHHTDDPRGGEPEVHSSDEGEPTAMQPEEYAAYVHEQNHRVLESKPYLWGTFAWNMFDFGSANRREGDVLGVNTKGLVSFDRQTRKDPFYFYKANWSPEPVTYVVGRRYVDRAYAVVDVRVYSNADSVDLSLDGEPVGTLTADRCAQRTCVFEDVRLRQGPNRLTAVGHHGGEVVADTVEWSLDHADVNIASGMLWTGHVASDGARFGSDAFFVGGTPGHVGEGDPEAGLPEGVTGTDDPMLFKFFREGEFRYEIPLDDGRYEVTLGFIEPEEDADAGDRVFTVRANGAPLLEELDVVEQAGEPMTALTRTFTVDVSGGRLVLEYAPSEGDALSSHIRIRRRP